METVSKKKLSELVNLDDIHSIVVVNIGRSKRLCISLKADCSLSFLDCLDGVSYIRMNRFSYTFPVGIAIPKEYYKYIIISELRDDVMIYNHFLFAQIIKHIPFGSRRERIWKSNHQNKWKNVALDL